MKIKINFSTLLRQIEKNNNKTYSNTAISRALPMGYNQVKKLKNDNLTRFDLLTLERILNFFNREGLDIGPSDLFVEAKALGAKCDNNTTRNQPVLVT